MLIIKILTSSDIPKISKIKKEFDVFRVVDINQGKLKMVEMFNKDGVFRGFGKDTKAAFKKAKKVLINFYKNK
ncbi:hypothetical protein CPU12_10425 [Malaciobacter molluscorum LMG 25693]|uniref:Uncharacterized protein n=1 Tax=Malaciobacter molluscorum LMG 25693 TaxID=870501 RepID=A0A2G1DG16_9BACT|nr:hypothetical protein [Malaciobacter molluscorum]AXX91101.1 hypothetical protein AMOL_0061 [Malaciobacter molluscorum LMG 25693]PHO17452.1 hypothetical protein CPU12_10425 [Malaciobacter molluscorum LMG 25693]